MIESLRTLSIPDHIINRLQAMYANPTPRVDKRDEQSSRGQPLFGIRQDFMIQICIRSKNLPIMSDWVHELSIQNSHLSHLFIHQRKVLNVLSRVLYHRLSERPFLPEINISLHLKVDLVFLWVDIPSVFLKKVIETDIYVLVVISLQEVRD